MVNLYSGQSGLNGIQANNGWIFGQSKIMVNVMVALCDGGTMWWWHYVMVAHAFIYAADPNFDPICNQNFFKPKRNCFNQDFSTMDFSVWIFRPNAMYCGHSIDTNLT